MNKWFSIGMISVLGIGLVAIFVGARLLNVGPSGSQDGQHIEIRDGIQYITIQARGGYSPNRSQAQANIPTRLIVKTDGTYDCSAALVIKSLGYQKVLPPTGEEVIDVGTPQPGMLQGLCSMGMYNFSVDFK